MQASPSESYINLFWGRPYIFEIDIVACDTCDIIIFAKDKFDTKKKKCFRIFYEENEDFSLHLATTFRSREFLRFFLFTEI